MFDDKSLLISTLRNPTNIAIKALNEIENRLNGKITIADPNAPFCHLLEFGCPAKGRLLHFYEYFLKQSASSSWFMLDVETFTALIIHFFL